MVIALGLWCRVWRLEFWCFGIWRFGKFGGFGAAPGALSFVLLQGLAFGVLAWVCGFRGALGR